MSRLPSPESIQQIIRTPEIEFPPPGFTAENSEYESALLDGLGESSVSPSSPSSNNFQEPDRDSVSSSNRRQRLTTVGSTTCHPTMNGE